jgi:uncharacterized protein
MTGRVGAPATLRTPVPVPDADSAGFWESARAGVLSIDRCTQCRRWQHPPLEACRSCGQPTRFEPVSGRGEVFSFIVVRQATVPGHEPPYVVALVELAEQPGIRLTGVLQGPVDGVHIGMPVEARLVPVGDGEFRGPEFVPVSR